MIDYVIIPARGGSKRIPHKNLALFNGISMLERSITLAQSVSKNVIVSSEDSKILDFAYSLNAMPFKRENSLASDNAPTLPVISNVLQALKKEQKIKKDSIILCLYATAMFATKELILQSLNLLKQESCAYVVPVIENARVLRSFTLENNRLNFIFKEYMDTRSQDLPKTYNDAGQFYLGYASSFLDSIALLGESSLAIEMPLAYDIDTPKDLQIAEILAQNLKL